MQRIQQPRWKLLISVDEPKSHGELPGHPHPRLRSLHKLSRYSQSEFFGRVIGLSEKVPWRPGRCPRSHLFVRSLTGGGLFWALAAICALLLCPRSGARTLDPKATAAASEPARAFRDFLAHPPWIRHIIFRQSGTYWPEARDQYDKFGRLIKELPGYDYPTRFGTYEAALQPHGYYLKMSSNAPAYRITYTDGRHSWKNPAPGKETVWGASAKYCWDLIGTKPALGIIPKKRADGASPKNEGEAMNRYWKYKVEAIRRLGLDPLALSSIHWINDTTFTGRWANTNPFRTKHPYEGAVNGKIVRFDNEGQPLTVKYSIMTSHLTNWLVEYSYLPGRLFPPYRIVSYRPGTQGPRYTNFIDSLKTGLDPAASGGYKPSQFCSDLVRLANLVIQSNGVSYTVSQLGHWRAIDETPPDYHLLGASRNSAIYHAIAAAILGLGVIAGLVGAISAWRRRGN